MITNQDIAFIESVYPELQLPALNEQQVRFVAYYTSGMSANHAASMAGYKGRHAGANLLRNNDAVRLISDYVIEKNRAEVGVTRELINQMLLDAHSNAANTMEQVAAIRELGKINALYPTTSGGININLPNGSAIEGQTTVTTYKQLESMNESELLQLAGARMAKLVGPADDVVDAEVIEEPVVMNRDLDIEVPIDHSSD